MTEASAVIEALQASENRQEQLLVLQQSWRCAEAAPMTLPEAEVLLSKLAKLTTLREQHELLQLADGERRAVAALEVAVAPVMMMPPVLRSLLKAIQRHSGTSGFDCGTWAPALAHSFDELERGCFISASQAAELMAAVLATDPKPLSAYWHVVCSRVVDKWNLNEREHSQVCCYYGWDAPYALRIVGDTPLDDKITLQNKVLSHMGRADHTTYSHSRKLPAFAAQIIADNLKAGSSGTRADVCCVCLDDCADGSPLFTCSSCKNRLHSRCCHSWVLAKGSESDACCPYCRAPISNGSFSIGELPASPET